MYIASAPLYVDKVFAEMQRCLPDADNKVAPRTIFIMSCKDDIKID